MLYIFNSAIFSLIISCYSDFINITNALDHESNEIDLWNAFRKGNRQAFEGLYRSHYAALYHYGHRITSDTEAIRDSIHTLFIDLWRRREYLGETDQLRPYLYQGLRRLLVKYLKAQRKVYAHDAITAALLPSQEEVLITSEKNRNQKIKLQQALEALTNKQREVMYLRFYERLDNQAIAKRMDITVNTVYNLVSLALNHLRQLLKNPTDLLFLLLMFY